MEGEQDQTLDFFNQMFEMIPQNFRQTPRDYLEPEEKPVKMSKNQKKKLKEQKKSQQPASILELKQRAHQKVQAEQQVNRDKSRAKILELTAGHKKQQGMFNDLGDSEGEGAEKPQKGEKVYKSKGKLDETKLQNKRIQKEAKKAKKINSKKGIIETKNNPQIQLE